MKKPKILIVDDEEIIRDSLAEWLTDSGYEALTAPDGLHALDIIKQQEIDVMISDLKMPGMDGIELLKKTKQINPDLPIIIMTAYGTVNSAIEVIKSGAYDYLEKPFCPERGEILLKNILIHQTVLKENIALKKELAKKSRVE